MTTEIEKTFFDTFGIEPKEAIFCSYDGACPFDYPCDECPYFLDNKGSYPQISDSMLLELIFILTTLLDTTIYEDVFITVAKNREELKKDIFQECMLYKQHIKHQVRTLFEEGEQ